MKNSKDRLYIKDWMDIQPYKIGDHADNYFVQLTNEMLKIVNTMMGDNFSTQVKRSIALSVTAYFQDIISGLGLWNAFRNKHFSLYGKYLPFYDLTENYDPEEINVEDIFFLIWSIIELNMKDDGGFVNPENPMAKALGIILYELIDEEYETAPESEKLQNYFIDKIDYDDFFSFREELYWLFYKSYLIAPYTEGRLEEIDRELKKHESGFSRDHINALAYSQKYEPVFTAPCGPLALKPYEWVAAIVGEKSNIGEMLLQTKLRFDMPRTYFIESEDETSYLLLPFDSEEIIKLHKTSLQSDFIGVPGRDAILCSLVFYNGRWMMSGFVVNIEKKAFLEDKEEFNDMKRNIEHTKMLFQKAYPKKTVVYANGIDELTSIYKKLFSDNLGNTMPDLDKDGKFIIFLDKTDRLITMSEVAVFIEDKENPCYDKDVAKLEGLGIFMNHSIPPNIINYLVKNKLLSYISINSLIGSKRGKQLVQQNMDFLFRFFQPNSFS